MDTGKWMLIRHPLMDVCTPYVNIWQSAILHQNIFENGLIWANGDWWHCYLVGGRISGSFIII
jgi:hypothetical protein